MDMNSFFIRRHNADAERSDSIQDARDAWAANRATQIIEVLAGMTSTGRAVYPPMLLVKPRDSKTVGGKTEVSVFEEFGWWLGENTDLLTGANTRDLLTCPIRTDIKLFKQFAAEHADYECGCKSDDYFADDRDDWEAA
jgi:hypothetical protein